MRLRVSAQVGASLTWLTYAAQYYDRLPPHVVFAKDNVRRLLSSPAAHLRAHHVHERERAREREWAPPQRVR